MKKVVPGSFIFFLLIFTINNLSAQELPTSNTNTEVADTVIIQKDPVMIVKKVFVEDKKPERNSKKWIEIFFAPFYNSNRFIACPSFEDYTNSLKTKTGTSRGYSAAITYNYLVKHLYFNAGLGISSYYEKFSFSGLNNTKPNNIYNYADFYTSIGYKITLRKNYCIFNIGLISRKLISLSGKTIALDHTENDLNNEKQFANYSIWGTGGIKLITNLSDRLKLTTEPFFSKSLSPLTKDLIPFVERKNTFGIKIGLGITLR